MFGQSHHHLSGHLLDDLVTILGQRFQHGRTIEKRSGTLILQFLLLGCGVAQILSTAFCEFTTHFLALRSFSRLKPFISLYSLFSSLCETA